jgi:hypothetical protein
MSESIMQKVKDAAKSGLTAVETALGFAKAEGQKVAAAATTVVTTDAPAVQAAIKAGETAAVAVAQSATAAVQQVAATGAPAPAAS